MCAQAGRTPTHWPGGGGERPEGRPGSHMLAQDPLAFHVHTQPVGFELFKLTLVFI